MAVGHLAAIGMFLEESFIDPLGPGSLLARQAASGYFGQIPGQNKKAELLPTPLFIGYDLSIMDLRI
jgi:hypothetical protein